jgi:ComF family protein
MRGHVDKCVKGGEKRKGKSVKSAAAAPSILSRAMPLHIPNQCRICGQWHSTRVWLGRGRIDRAWCGPCEVAFTQAAARCIQCSLRTAPGIERCAACSQSPPNWSTGAAAVDYAFPWSELINAYKSQGDVGLGHGFAALMHSDPIISRLLRSADAWVGVPLSDGALSGRGFHQTADLITQLRHQLPRPPPDIRHALKRLGTNKGQKVLGLHARAHNLSGAFIVNASAIRGIKGRHLALIDDVSTTGATLTAVMDVLLRAGAASVNTVVLARTPKPDG